MPTGASQAVASPDTPGGCAPVGWGALLLPRDHVRAGLLSHAYGAGSFSGYGGPVVAGVVEQPARGAGQGHLGLPATNAGRFTVTALTENFRLWPAALSYFCAYLSCTRGPDAGRAPARAI